MKLPAKTSASTLKPFAQGNPALGFVRDVIDGSRRHFATVRSEEEAARTVACLNACLGMELSVLQAAPPGHAAEWFAAWSATPVEAHEHPAGIPGWIRDCQQRVEAGNSLRVPLADLLGAIGDGIERMSAADIACAFDSAARVQIRSAAERMMTLIHAP